MKKELLNDLKSIKKDFKTKNFKKQIANILTSSRLLSPFILIPLAYFNRISLVIIMIIIFSLTDTFDGYFARKYHSVTTFGAYLDAVVDKIYALSILISLVININLENINLVLLIIIISLEFIIGIINIILYFKKYNPYSTKIGKIKTVFLFSLISVLYLNKLININNLFLIIFAIITIILQILTSYFSLKIKKGFN